MINMLKNPNVKWLFGGIGAAVVGGYIVWRITGGEKPAPPQQITTPLYMPGSGGFAGGDGGGGGVAPLDDIDIGDPMAMMAIQAEIERERIASQERMFMASLTQSEKQESPMYVPSQISEGTVSSAASKITKGAPKGKKVYIQSSLPDGKRIVAASADRGYDPRADSNRTSQLNLTAAQTAQGIKYIESGDWHGLYNLARSVGATTQQISQLTGISYNDAVAWQQQQGLKVL